MIALHYMLREAREGIRRNLGAAIAAVLIIFISLSIAGAGLLVKSGLDEAIDYLQSQVKIKLFVDPAADVAALAVELRKTGKFDAVEVETAAQMLDQMRQFFVGREYLFTAFQGSEIPASISLTVGTGQDIDAIVASLPALPGVADVIYPQAFARSVLSWTSTVNWYGSAAIVVLLLASFLTICIAISLALHQRRKDIRIKLLLGASEPQVRAQFLFEGVLLGAVGGILATFVVYGLHEFGLRALHARFSFVFNFTAMQLAVTAAAIVLLGAAMGLAGSYFTTRRLIDNA